MNRVLLIVCLGIWFCTSMWAKNEKILPYREKLVTGKLENGLTYYIYPNAFPKGEAVYRLFVKSGSVMESERQLGLAHFLEHMAFNGSINFPDNKMVSFLESKGAKFGQDLNAHTSFNETVYKLQLPSLDSKMVDSTLTILADWAGGLTINPVQVEKERGVILSEWLSKKSAKRESETAFLMELLNGSRFSERMTIGDTAVIKHCTPQDIRDYYQAWYHPSLMAIAVVGDINPRQIEDLIRKKFGILQASKLTAPKKYGIPPYKKEEAKLLTNESLKTIDLDMIQLLPLPNPVRTASDYENYLVRSLTNRLMKVRMNAFAFMNPAYKKASIQCSGFLNATGVLLASLELQPGKVQEGIREFVSQQEQLFNYGFTKHEIERAKKNILSDLENQVQSKQGIPSIKLMDEIYSDFYVGNRFISLEQEYELLRRYLPQIDSVKLVKNLTKMYKPSKMHYLLRADERVKKEVDSESELLKVISSARQQKVGRYYTDMFVPDVLCDIPIGGKILREETISELGAVSWWLDNGARVIFKQSDLDKEKIMLTGFRKGGLYALDSTYYYSGAISPGIVAVSGAGEFTRDALNHYLAGNSASMRLLVDKTRTGVAGIAQLKDMQTLFQLLYTKWTAPRLDVNVYNQMIEKTKESYRTKVKTPEELFQRDLGWLLNGKNYTNVEFSDSLITNCVKQEDMLPLFNRFYGSANGYTFIILGDCTAEDIKKNVLTYLGGLPGGATDLEFNFKGRMIPNKECSLIRYTGDSPKASVSLTFQQDSLAEVNLGLFNLKADIMKSMLRTCLLTKLREEMGKVYSVSVASSASLYPEFLSRTIIGFVCLPEDVDTLIRSTQGEILRLCEQPQVFDTILKNVKSNMLKEFALDQQKNSYWSSLIRNSIYNQEEDWNYVKNYEQIVNQITVGEIASFARTLLLNTPMVKGVLYPKQN